VHVLVNCDIILINMHGENNTKSKDSCPSCFISGDGVFYSQPARGSIGLRTSLNGAVGKMIFCNKSQTWVMQ
jgi:hypothetical protein